MNFGNGWLEVVNTFRNFIFENWGVTKSYLGSEEVLLEVGRVENPMNNAW